MAAKKKPTVKVSGDVRKVEAPAPAPAPKKPKHSISIVEDLGDQDFIMRYGMKYVAECACGWVSVGRSTAEKAAREGEGHLA